MNHSYMNFIVTVAGGNMKFLLSTNEWGIRSASDALDAYLCMKEKFPESEGYNVVVDGYYIMCGELFYDRIDEDKLRSMAQNEENHRPMSEDERISNVR